MERRLIPGRWPGMTTPFSLNGTQRKFLKGAPVLTSRARCCHSLVVVGHRPDEGKDPMGKLKTNVPVVLFFLLLTVVMTYPTAWNLGSALNDPGDPLLNTWILAWNAHKAAAMEWGSLFDTNIFYPNERTLAYSELLISQSIVAFPVLKITGNPIFAYNFVLLFCFFTNAWGMYLLARRLSGSAAGGIMAGIVYAFSPFMFSHLPHLQVFGAAGIPFTFLWLHKYASSRRMRDLLVAGVFFALQALANSYYALYIALFVGLFLLVLAARDRRFLEPGFWGQMAGFAVLAAVTIGPFFLQYILMRREQGFERSLGFQAEAASFISAPSLNRLYGGITDRFSKPEADLFPGLLPVVLALTAWLLYRFRTPPRAASREDRLSRVLSRLLGVTGILMAVILVTGGYACRVGGVQISCTRVRTLSVMALVLLAIRFVRSGSFRARVLSRLPGEDEAIRFYGLVLLLALLFSFGSTGPYFLLQRFVPGFDGLRVASRFHIFTLLGLGVLTAFGMKRLLSWLPRPGRIACCLLLPALLLAEYFSLPLPSAPIRTGNDIPPLYRWLAGEPGDFALVELPIPPPGPRAYVSEVMRTYYSCYHWKKLVNGYSGYAPPLYTEINRRWRKEPLADFVRDMKALGVRYVVLHRDAFSRRKRGKMDAQLAGLSELVMPGMSFGEARVYEVRDPEAGPWGEDAQRETWPRSGWRVEAGESMHRAKRVLDGKQESRWHTDGPQTRGAWMRVDLGAVRRISGIEMTLGTDHMDYPRAYRVDVSTDGATWTEVARDESVVVPLGAYRIPAVMPLSVLFAPCEARFVRITCESDDDTYYWSIHELNVYR